MLIPATVLVMAMGGVLSAFIVAGAVMTVLDNKNGQRRYGPLAESVPQSPPLAPGF